MSNYYTPDYYLSNAEETASQEEQTAESNPEPQEPIPMTGNYNKCYLCGEQFSFKYKEEFTDFPCCGNANFMRIHNYCTYLLTPLF